VRASAPVRQRWLAPEVVQTSAMDCGPAALKCLLEGWRIPVSYARLREACQTDVDGTSIDTLEEVAGQLGLDAEQVMLPLDHLLLAQAQVLPALVVVRLPSGVTHFVVAWRRHGSLVQVMDPARGRRFTSIGRFLSEIYVHRMAVDAAGWREWIGSPATGSVLAARMSELGSSRAEAEALLDRARLDSTWRSLAQVDAGVRLASALVRARGVAAGRDARRLLDAFLAAPEQIPESYWSVRPAPDVDDQLLLRGAVLVRVAGRAAADASQAAPAARSPDVDAALRQEPARPGQELVRLLRADGRLAPAALFAALVLAAGAVIAEATLFRALLDVGRELVRPGQRVAAVAALVAFLVGLLLLDLGIAKGVLRAGRQLELRLRVAVLEKLPRLFDRYFRSRLTSDMAERSHAAHTLRQVPDLAARFVRSSADLLCTTIGMIWLSPACAPLALLAGAISLGVPLALQPLLIDRDLRLRTHTGSLTRFYFDALRGIVPIRTHVAEPAVRRAHEARLTEWVRAGRRVVAAAVSIEALGSLASVPITAWLIASQLSHMNALGSVLLLAYWALNLPYLGQEIALVAREAARQRNVSLRLEEVLGAPEASPEVSPEATFDATFDACLEASPERPAEIIGGGPAPREPDRSGVAIAFEGVSVRAGGHLILEHIDLAIRSGCHLAIVGPSGAGKSTLVGLLAGWHQAVEGRVLVDGLAVDEAHLEQLRRDTAWVDPAVHLWNRSLLENLRYGGQHQVERFDEALDDALLRDVLKRLPDGLQTRLGEGGTRLSGGEGQRVRLGRAFLRPHARLVILDEPFRGLDRDQRRVLLRRARARWTRATMLLVTHDVGDTLDLDRVIVVEGGRLVEDGVPREIAARQGSRYSQLLAAEEAIRRGLWQGAGWRRFRLEGGLLVDGAESR